MFICRIAVFLGIWVGVASAEWPANFLLVEGSKSPDGRFGVLMPTLETDEDNGQTNYLADLTAHRTLGKIKGAFLFENANNRKLTATWAADSGWCLLKYDNKWSFETLTALEISPDQKTFQQTDLTSAVWRKINATLPKPKGDEDSLVAAQVGSRISGDQKIRLRVLASTNPKEMENQTTSSTLFQGTYDLAAHRWLVSAARIIPNTLADSVTAAFFTPADPGAAGQSFENPTEEGEYLDTQLNLVYGCARALLPAAEFAAVKARQVSWLKERDAAPSPAEKNQLVIARIAALQDLLW